MKRTESKRQKLNILLNQFQGYNKSDKDFISMINMLYDNGLMLLDGKNDYNHDMTNKHYTYRLALEKIDEYGQIVDGETIGYLSAYKFFTNGLDSNYEILAYIS